jgi:Dockerin type I domain
MISKKIIILLSILVFLFTSGLYAQGEKAGEEINWQVLSNGGGEMTSANYKINGTICQTATTVMTSANNQIHSGYWQDFGEAQGDCLGQCGDANGDGDVNVSDAVWIVNYVFIGGPPPQPIVACGDINTDADVNVSDAMYLVVWIFAGGGPPTTCSPGIGWPGGDCCEY